MRQYCFFILIALKFVIASAQSGEIKLKHIRTEDGLSHESVNDIEQDRRGYIWVATADGLNRYDGNSLKTYRHNYNDSSSLSFNWIWDIYPLSNGNLLVGTRKGLDIYLADLDCFKKINFEKNKVEININQIQSDSEGNIWLATWGDGVFVLDSAFNLLRTYSTTSLPQLASDLVGRIVLDQESKNIWLGTWNGLEYLNPVTNEIIHFNETQYTITGNKIIALIADPKGGVWYGTSTRGYGYINASTSEKKLYNQLPDAADVVTSLVKDREGNIWVGTYAHGLMEFNQKGNLLKQFSNDPSDPFSLLSNNIQSLCIDDQGSIWIGDKGLSVYQELYNQFPHIRTSLHNGLLNKSVWVFTEDAEGIIYIGTENGLSTYNPAQKKLDNYLPQNDGFDINIIYSMAYDKEGKIWLGTEQNILCYFDILKKRFVVVDPVLADKHEPLQEDINALTLRNGILWIGTFQKGLFRYHLNSNKLESFDNSNIETSNWASFYHDDQDNLWLCSIGDGVYMVNPSDSIELHLKHDPAEVNSISNNIVRCITKASNGAFWIGTSNGLNYYLPARDTIYRFYEHNGLPNNNICGILEDSRNDIWVSTFGGISRITVPEFRFTNYDYSDGLQSNSFNVNAYFKSISNELFFGGKNGITHFQPSSIQSNEYKGQTNISAFYEQGKTLNLYTQTNSITLRHTQNFFSIAYMISDYINVEKNSFKYRLEGIDQEWLTTNSYSVNYTNIPPGKYNFQVIGINGDGVSSSEAAQLDLIIRKPWYFSSGLLCLYILVIVSGVYLFYRSLSKRKQLKADLKSKDIEKQKLMEMDRLRSELLSNISHEIRTPLNLILSPLDILRSKIPEKQKLKMLDVISWNANRLLFMVNQILDLSRIDADQIRLTIEHVYLAKILEPILTTYQSYAINQNRLFTWSIPDKPIIVSVDVDKFEKIVLNLLSNAFKFSGEEDGVDFKASLFESDNKKGIKISVTDNGVGISQEEQSKIFKRFYSSKTNNHHGIGIGLALTKQLVEMHKGRIEVRSEPDQYTSFDVYLPICAEEGTLVGDIQGTGFSPGLLPMIEIEDSSIVQELPQIPTNNTFKILTVEDDHGLREMLVNLLKDRYSIFQANNGDDALKQINKIPIDLIITDLIMPGMDGMEFIRQLKNNPKTINIPIVVLSARINEQIKLDAMQLGVDAFIDKPFNNKELLIQIENILQLRKRLKEAILHTSLVEKSKELNLSGDNDQFIKHVEEIILKNITNSQFSVEFLAGQLNISRVQLHRRIKSITTITVSEFIRNYRLQLAAQYILSGKTRITQIAYEVGFNNPSYFAEHFKKSFGCNPSEYKNRNA